jgi:hypothetical protein
VNEAKEGCRNVKISSFSRVVRSSIRAPVAALPDRYGHGVKKGLSVPGSGITGERRRSVGHVAVGRDRSGTDWLTGCNSLLRSITDGVNRPSLVRLQGIDSESPLEPGP